MFQTNGEGGGTAGLDGVSLCSVCVHVANHGFEHPGFAIPARGYQCEYLRFCVRGCLAARLLACLRACVALVRAS